MTRYVAIVLLAILLAGCGEAESADSADSATPTEQGDTYAAKESADKAANLQGEANEYHDHIKEVLTYFDKYPISVEKISVQSAEEFVVHLDFQDRQKMQTYRRMNNPVMQDKSEKLFQEGLEAGNRMHQELLDAGVKKIQIENKYDTDSKITYDVENRTVIADGINETKGQTFTKDVSPQALEQIRQVEQGVSR